MNMTFVLSALFLLSLVANVLHSRIRGGKTTRLVYTPSDGALRHMTNAWVVLAIFASVIGSALLWRGGSRVVVGYLSIPIVGLAVWYNIYAIIHRSTQCDEPKVTDVPEGIYLAILELYKAGKKDEAVQLGKRELSSPAEFKKAWRYIKDYDNAAKEKKT